jgi:hypothetical protein
MSGARRPAAPVPEAAIAAIRENHSQGIPAGNIEIVEFTWQLPRRHRVDDASFGNMQRRVGNDGLSQLTVAIVYCSTLATTVNACELEAAPGAEVLRA